MSELALPAMTEAGATVPRRRTHQLGVAVACMLGNIFGLSTILYVPFSLFLMPVTTSLGWSRADLSFSLTLISTIDLFAYPLAGLLMDRLGARVVILAGNLLFGLSVMALALIGSARLPAYLLFALIGLTAALPSTVLIARVIAAWFTVRRGLAMSVCSGLAFGIGGTLTVTLAQPLIADHGWRTAYAVLGALPIVVVLPVMALLLRNAPTAGERRHAERDATLGDPGLVAILRSRPFLLLFASAVLASGAIHVVSSHLALFIHANGLNARVAPRAISALAITTALWQLVLGFLLDRVASPRIAGWFLIIAGIGAAVIFAGHSATTVIAGSVMLGIGSGTEFGLMPFALARYFGLRHYGLIYGGMFGCVAFAIGLSPFLLDLGYGVTGSYAPFVEGSALLLGGCGVLLFAVPRFELSDRTMVRPGR